MALSGTFKSSEDNSANTNLDAGNPRWCSFIYVNWTAQQSIESNTSTISWKCYGGSNYSNTTSYVACGPVVVKINGTTVLNITGRFNLSKDELIGSGSITVPHNNDGTKSVSASISAAIYSFASNCNYSGTFTLNAIPRATTIDSLSCATSYLDGTMTYKYTPQTASYYNRCNISLNLDGTYIAVKSINLGKKPVSQQTATVTLSSAELATIYNKLPKTTKGVLRFTFRTYSDSGYSAQVGNAGYKEITLTIPTAIQPTASLSVSVVNDNAWIKSLGVYVQGYSGLSATLSTTAGTGASISAYSISGGNYSSNKNTLSVSKITTSGSIKFTGKATDSRGRSASSSKTITVLPYSKPAITSLTVERGTYDGSWTADDDGADVRVLFKTTLALKDNGNVYSAAFKVDGTAVTPDYGATTGLASGASGVVYFFDMDGERSHTLTLTTKDEVGNSSFVSITIPTIHITIEFNDSGKGIAFGKTSEKDAFECAWPAYFTGGAYTNGFRLPEIQHGSVRIMPSAANTPASAEITFAKDFSGTPIVLVTPVTSVPGTTVLGVGVNDVSKTGCTVWMARTNTTETTVNWIAIY